jgi:hypothetical protein
MSTDQIATAIICNLRFLGILDGTKLMLNNEPFTVHQPLSRPVQETISTQCLLEEQRLGVEGLPTAWTTAPSAQMTTTT